MKITSGSAQALIQEAIGLLQQAGGVGLDFFADWLISGNAQALIQEAIGLLQQASGMVNS